MIDKNMIVEFLRRELADIEKKIAWRDYSQKFWLTGTDKSWRDSARWGGTKLINRKSRVELSEIDGRIAIKLRKKAEMFKAVIAAINEL